MEKHGDITRKTVNENACVNPPLIKSNATYF
ncbi:hypothetical protein NSE_0141 [Neorickettsia sennetsu str. Miyayama]|uniref:Uncharacterized protein n=1 Tax=Ehrlichia sennetsu (strain ATCC VR-367 / Miyayama) TaxID=222891 RepID=Q2GEQ6_EHRS3|nr:hypothetical protein NSE_0141 [Neorickettsia sennetsu str. Miyayama]